MRLPALTMTIALVALAGCASDEPDAERAPVDEAPSAQVTVPAPLRWSGDVVVGADPFNFVPPAPVGTGMPCSMEISTCYVHEFSVAAEDVGTQAVSVTATLAWGIPANDLDLYLYQGDTQLSSDGINALGAAEVPPTEQVLRHGGLAAGDYALWVVVWNGAADSYTLDAEFSA